MELNQALEQMCGKVQPPDPSVKQASRDHWDQIAKPLNGLGLLETMVSQIAAIQRREMPSIGRRAIVVMCADNGVVEEGVTQTSRDVTAVVTENFARGLASVNRMARIALADVIPVDMGVAADLKEPGIYNCKLGYGTRNIRREPAMSVDQAMEGILSGIRLAGQLKDAGYEILGTGEMGIGNTTTASAMASALLDCPPERVTGAGAGLSREGIRHKTEVIRDALRRHGTDSRDAVEVLASLGGYDIAGLTGLFLGGAVYQIPIVADGMISAVAALAAARICPPAAGYMLASHMGREPACRMVMDALGLVPVIHGQLALGEGTGAVLLFPMLDMALQVYEDSTTFEDIQIPAYKHFGEEEH